MGTARQRYSRRATTATDFAGRCRTSLPFAACAANGAGATAFGAAKVLCASIAAAVSTLPAAALHLGAGDVDVDVGRLARIGVDERQVQLAVLGARRRRADGRDGRRAQRVAADCRSASRGSDIGILERHVHLEHVVGRRQHHLVPSVRIIACSTLTICAMLVMRTRSAWRVEDVEVERGHERRRAACSAGTGSPTGCPPRRRTRCPTRRRRKPDLLLGIVLVQHGDVVLDESLPCSASWPASRSTVFVEAGGRALCAVPVPAGDV